MNAMPRYGALIGLTIGLSVLCMPLNLVFAQAIWLNPFGYINDFAQILDDNQESTLEQNLDAFEKQTSHEISVVTLESLDRFETIETQAEKIFRTWGIGKAKQDNGILILIVSSSRQMRIEVGYGLEPYLTDAQTGKIIRHILAPAFKQGDFIGGITRAVTSIQEFTLEGASKTLETEDHEDAQQAVVFIAFLLFYLTFGILGRNTSWWEGGVLGGVVGLISGIVYEHSFWNLFWVTSILTAIGLFLDYILSLRPQKNSSEEEYHREWWYSGSGSGQSNDSFDGFDGFGGGMSGGGGASGDW